MHHGVEAYLRGLPGLQLRHVNLNGMMLSANILPYQYVAYLSAWSGSLQVNLGQRVTASGSIHLDRVARRLPKA